MLLMAVVGAVLAVARWSLPLGMLLGYAALWVMAVRSGNCRTLVEVCVLLAIGGFLLALAAPAQQSTCRRGRPTCQNNIRQIGLALQTYHYVHGKFPPAY